MNEREKIIRIILGICLILLGIVVTIKEVSASIPYDNYALKWQLCDAMNFTGMPCDVWWNAFADLPKCNQTTTCTLSNQSIDLTKYYTKTEIDTFLKNFTGGNVSLIYSDGNNTYVTRVEFTNQTLALRDSIMNNYVSNTTFWAELQRWGYNVGNSISNGSSNFDYTWLIIGGILVIAIGLFIYPKIKQGRRIASSPMVNITTESNDIAKMKMMRQEMEKLENKQINAEKDIREQIKKEYE